MIVAVALRPVRIQGGFSPLFRSLDACSRLWEPRFATAPNRNIIRNSSDRSTIHLPYLVPSNDRSEMRIGCPVTYVDERILTVAGMLYLPV